MTALPDDYDSDPGRFLSAGKHPHDDVHPYVAARFAAAGARTVLDVGGGNGRLARLLPGLSMRCLLIDLSSVMLSLAPRPVVRADGARLPVAGACADAVAALYTLYHYDDPLEPVREARRVLRPGGLFAACAPNRDSDPELARAVPGWGAASPSTAKTPSRSWRRSSAPPATRCGPNGGTASASPCHRSPMPPRACGCTGSARPPPRTPPPR
jgi:SAM-dependent methyltransferase